MFVKIKTTELVEKSFSKRKIDILNIFKIIIQDDYYLKRKKNIFSEYSPFRKESFESFLSSLEKSLYLGQWSLKKLGVFILGFIEIDL